MSSLYDRVKDDQDFFRKLLGKLPGFSGYFEKQNRRAADKILRNAIGDRFEEHWNRISALQNSLVDQGGIAYVDDLEGAAIKIRQFIDRVKAAAHGYASFFDAVKIKEDELARVYQYDYAMLDISDQIKGAIDNVESALGTEGLPAAIRQLTTLAGECIGLLNQRKEAMIGGVTTPSK
jgi:hypothetical protein